MSIFCVNSFVWHLPENVVGTVLFSGLNLIDVVGEFTLNGRDKTHNGTKINNFNVISCKRPENRITSVKIV